MNNDRYHSQMQRYYFNSKRIQPNHQTGRISIILWLIGIVLAVIIITSGIKVTSHHFQKRSDGRTQVVKSPSRDHGQQSTGQRIHHHLIVNHNPNPKPSTPTKNQSRPQQTSPSIAGKQRFSSVRDATAWARVTEHRWLKDGYTNYKIVSDGQGDYDLQFTK